MSLPLPPPHDPYLAGIAQRNLALPMPPVPARYTPVNKWIIERIGRDAVLLTVTAAPLTRTETFRLIGELERIGATL